MLCTHFYNQMSIRKFYFHRINILWKLGRAVKDPLLPIKCVISKKKFFLLHTIWVCMYVYTINVILMYTYICWNTLYLNTYSCAHITVDTKYMLVMLSARSCILFGNKETNFYSQRNFSFEKINSLTIEKFKIGL